MRAFIGQFDRVSHGMFGLGAAIGAIWLVALERLEARHQARRERRLQGS